MRPTLLRLLFLSSTVIALAVACGGSDDGGGGGGTPSEGEGEGASEGEGEGPARVCDPGDTKACACAGGTQGAQECKANGSGWGACDCPPAEGEGEGPARVCDPGDVQVCPCTGGDQGTQSCNAAGSGWGSCDCPEPSEGEGEGPAEGEGEGPAEGEGEGPAEGEGEGPAEGEGEGPAEGEGEGPAQLDCLDACSRAIVECGSDVARDECLTTCTNVGEVMAEASRIGVAECVTATPCADLAGDDLLRYCLAALDCWGAAVQSVATYCQRLDQCFPWLPEGACPDRTDVDVATIGCMTAEVAQGMAACLPETACGQLAICNPFYFEREDPECPGRPTVGAPCEEDDDCAEEGVCLTEGEWGFVGGYCSFDNADHCCPAGTIALDLGGVLCFRGCALDEDCRVEDGHICDVDGTCWWYPPDPCEDVECPDEEFCLDGDCVSIYGRNYWIGVTSAWAADTKLGGGDWDFGGSAPDLYVIVYLDGAEVGRTPTVPDNLFAEYIGDYWMAAAELLLDEGSELTFAVYDEDLGEDDPVGGYPVPAIGQLLSAGILSSGPVGQLRDVTMTAVLAWEP